MINSPYLFDRTLVAQSGERKKYDIWCKGQSTLPVSIFFRAIDAMQGGSPHCDVYLKRLIGLPGDRVQVDAEGKVIVNGKPLKEEYISNWCTGSKNYPCRTFDGTVPETFYFVLGDNRGNSWDSRYWPGGPFIHEKYILEKVQWIHKWADK